MFLKYVTLFESSVRLGCPFAVGRVPGKLMTCAVGAGAFSFEAMNASIASNSNEPEPSASILGLRWIEL
jgi:hypothetical protein